MKRNIYKRVFIIALLAAVLLVFGCSKGADAEPVHIIGFDELETESIASWREDMSGGYRLEKLKQGDLLNLFMQGEIPAYRRETDDNGIPYYESPFYVTEMYSGVELKYEYTQLDNDEDDEPISKEEYNAILEQIEITKTSWWYGE